MNGERRQSVDGGHGSVLRQIRSPLFVAGIVVGTVYGCAAAGNYVDRSSGVEVSSNLSGADTQVDVKLLEFNETQALAIADATAEGKVTSTGIIETFSVSAMGVGVGKNCEANATVEGKVTLDFDLLFGSITRVKGEDGKTNFVVDRSQLSATTTWAGAPTMSYFTIGKDGKPDYKDQNNFCGAAFRGFAANLAVVNANDLQNAITKNDKALYETLAASVLTAAREECAADLTDELDKAAEDALKANITQVVGNDPGKIGTVTFTGKYGGGAWSSPALVNDGPATGSLLITSTLPDGKVPAGGVTCAMGSTPVVSGAVPSTAPTSSEGAR